MSESVQPKDHYAVAMREACSLARGYVFTQSTHLSTEVRLAAYANLVKKMVYTMTGGSDLSPEVVKSILENGK